MTSKLLRLNDKEEMLLRIKILLKTVYDIQILNRVKGK